MGFMQYPDLTYETKKFLNLANGRVKNSSRIGRAGNFDYQNIMSYQRS